MIDMEPVVTAAILTSIVMGLVVLTALVAVGWEFAPSIRRRWVALRRVTADLTARHSHNARIAH